MAETVRVIAFPGAPNLPLFAAEAEGFLAAEGIELALELTPSSVYQAEETAAGRADMVLTAFDNVVAYAEGQGAADVDPGYVVVMGATQLEVSLVAAPDVAAVGDLAGRSVALDALATGFAFVFYEMLARAGLSPADVTLVPVGATPQRWEAVRDGTHAATLTIEPFTSLARGAGFTVVSSSAQLFESYQGGIVAARRAFAAAHPERVQGVLRALLRGLAWTRDPANREAATALLAARMPQIPPPARARVMESLLSPRSGLTPEGEILPEGMRTVLALRSRHGGGPELTGIDRYLDLSHLRAARG